MKTVNRTPEEQAILDNIVACLNYKKIEQKDLCEYLGFSSQMFTNWKNKSSNSYLKRLTKIAEFLDISVDHLLGKVSISGVENADHVIVLDNGRISGYGTPAEMLATNPIYQEVYNSQTKGSGDFDEKGGDNNG